MMGILPLYVQLPAGQTIFTRFRSKYFSFEKTGSSETLSTARALYAVSDNCVTHIVFQERVTSEDVLSSRKIHVIQYSIDHIWKPKHAYLTNSKAIKAIAEMYSLNKDGGKGAEKGRVILGVGQSRVAFGGQTGVYRRQILSLLMCLANCSTLTRLLTE